MVVWNCRSFHITPDPGQWPIVPIVLVPVPVSVPVALSVNKPLDIRNTETKGKYRIYWIYNCKRKTFRGWWSKYVFRHSYFKAMRTWRVKRRNHRLLSHQARRGVCQMNIRFQGNYFVHYVRIWRLMLWWYRAAGIVTVMNVSTTVGSHMYFDIFTRHVPVLCRGTRKKRDRQTHILVL